MGVDLRVEGERRLPIALEADLYWIAQEALNNVLKHAQARHVWVQLRFTPATVSIEVHDDGVGFDLDKARSAGGGVGLRSVAQRARRVGGVLTYESRSDEGTRMRVEVQL